MLDAAELIAVARSLTAESSGSPPSEASLRRAVSTSYYALFHMVLRAASDRFVGPGDRATASYRVIYRSFDHGHMRDTCVRLSVSIMRDKYKELFGRSALSADTRRFCGAFIQLQRTRVLADYDPEFRLPLSDAVSVIDSAEAAMVTFSRIEAAERTDLLSLLMVPART